MDELKRMLSLTKDPNPQIRKYALAQIEHLAEGEEEGVVDALRDSSRDADPMVSHQANRCLAVLLGRSFSSPARFLAPGELSTTGESSLDAGFEGVAFEELRASGFDCMASVFERLERFALDAEQGELAKKTIIAMGKIAAPAMLPTLRKTLHTPALTEVSAVVLPELGVAEAAGPLLDALEEGEGSIRQHVVLELGKFQIPETRRALLSLVDDKDPVVRANVALAMGDLVERQGLLDPLLRLLRDPEVWVVLYALRAMQRFNENEAVEAVVTIATTHQDLHVRATAVAALGWMRNELARAPLQHCLEDEDDRIRANAIESLDRLGMTGAEVSQAVSILENDGNNRVRGNLVVAVGHLSPERAVTLVKAMLALDEKWFLASAAWALKEVRLPGLVPDLLELARHEETEVSTMAARALAVYPFERVEMPALALLDDASPLVRAKAAALVGRPSASADTVTKLYSKLYNESDALVRSALVSALGRTGDPRVGDWLVEVLDDPEPRVQANTIETLGRLRGFQPSDAVAPYLMSGHNRLRANAILALWEAGNPEALRQLCAMLDEDDGARRISAVYVAGEIGRRLRFLESARPELLGILKQRFLELQRAKEESEGEGTDGAETGGELPEARGPDIDFLGIERAIAAYLKGDKAGAVSAIETMRSGGREGGLGAYFLSQIYMDMGEAAKSDERLVESCRRTRGFVRPHLELAVRASQRGDKKTSLNAYYRAFCERLLVHRELAQLGMELLLQEHANEASELLKHMLKPQPLLADVHGTAGRRYVMLARFRQAFRHLFHAHLDAPNDGGITLDLAFCCCHLESFALAKLLCEEIFLVAGSQDQDTVDKARRMIDLVNKKLVLDGEG